MFGTAAPLAVKRRRTRRRRRVLSACASVVVVALLVAAIVQSTSTTGSNVRVQGTGTATAGEATAAQLAAGHWEVIPAAPIAPRADAASIWTGRELIVWGGQAKSTGPTIVDDGAAYDPASDTWRALPSAPISRPDDAGQAVVWTGTEMVVWDATHGDGAAYDPTSNTWRALPSAPLPVSPFGLGVWTGDRALFVAGAHAAAFDPAANSWRAVTMPALPPLKPDEAPFWRAVAAGAGRVLAWAQTDDMSAPTILFRYDEHADRWTQLPASPGAVYLPLEAIAAGDRVLVRGYASRPTAGSNPTAASAWYDADSGVATRLPTDTTVTSEMAAGYFFSAWTGGAVWALNYLGRAGPDDVANRERLRPGRERVAEHSHRAVRLRRCHDAGVDRNRRPPVLPRRASVSVAGGRWPRVRAG